MGVGCSVNDNDVLDHDEYWVGPYGVLVSNNIMCVVAQDGYNNMRSDGSETFMYKNNAPLMTEAIYKQKYATYINGKYYYDDNTKNYWFGPYRVLVSNDIDEVVACDGYNTESKNGCVTKIYIKDKPFMSETIYKQKYAIYRNGKYYYNG